MGKPEGSPRPYSPQELKDTTKFADPASTDSYAIAKNKLWAEYNSKYAPAFQNFRNEIGNAVLAMNQEGKKVYSREITKMAKSRTKYCNTALDAFSEYVQRLTLAYMYDKAESYDIVLGLGRRPKPVKKAAKKRGKKV